MTMPVAVNDQSYIEFLAEIKHSICNARIRVSRAVSCELIELYWTIGKEIVGRQDRHGWGKSVVDRLAGDLRAEFPGLSGFSSPNVWFMRQMYLEYKDYPNLLQLVR